jgi:arylformamidase
MGVDSGTHMGGLVDFLHGAAGLDEMRLTATMGEARVIEIEHPREITANELSKYRLLPGEQVLFRTSNSARCWRSDSFVEDFVGLSEQAATHLAETGLPVKLHGSDGASARAILRPIGPSQPVSAEAAP